MRNETIHYAKKIYGPCWFKDKKGKSKDLEGFEKLIEPLTLAYTRGFP
jgi:hypothetical protein